MPSEREDKLENKPILGSIAIGYIAGGTEAILTNPLVTMKSCSQKGIPIPWKYWFPHNLTISQLKFGIANVARFLYRGTGARVTGIGLSVGVRMSIHDGLVKYVFPHDHLTLKQEIAISLTSGFVSAFLNTPIELGMTIQQTTDPKQRSENLIKTLRRVQKKWGIKKGLTGLTCISLRDGVVTSGFLTFAPKFKQYISKEYGLRDNLFSLVGSTAIGAGLSVLTHPLDTIKTTQQTNLRDCPDKNHHSIINSAAQIFDKKGVMGFYKGVFFRATRIGLHVGIITLISEKLTQAWENYSNKKPNP